MTSTACQAAVAVRRRAVAGPLGGIRRSASSAPRLGVPAAKRSRMRGRDRSGARRGARVEHRLAVSVAVVREGDLVAEQVAGGRDALADQQAGGGQPVEELLLAHRAGHCAPYGLAQFLACCAAPGLLARPCGVRRWWVRLAAVPSPGGDAAQAVVDFDAAAFGLGAAGFVVQAGPAAVLADEGGDDVDVVVGVPDGCPPAGVLVAVGGDAGGGDHAAGDGRPVLVGQDRVLRGGPYGQVPYVLRRVACRRAGR